MCHRQYPKIVFSKSICGKNWNIYFFPKNLQTLYTSASFCTPPGPGIKSGYVHTGAVFYPFSFLERTQ